MALNFKGMNLILDNFRTVLNGYSVDVQDVVRSAILDNVDVSNYIEICKSNPYRLDQIRLCKKEGIDDEAIYSIKNGDSIYKLRQLISKGTDIEAILQQLHQGTLNDYSIHKMISWVLAGYDLKGINLAIIPNSLFEVFEQGFQKGFDMRVYNNGKNYNPEYLRYCMIIQFNKKDVKPFVDKIWKVDCIKQLAVLSKSISVDKWNSFISKLNCSISSEKLSVLISCIKNGISVDKLVADVWSCDAIRVILLAFKDNINYTKLVDVGPDADSVTALYNEMKLSKMKKLGGRLSGRLDRK